MRSVTLNDNGVKIVIMLLIGSVCQIHVGYKYKNFTIKCEQN